MRQRKEINFITANPNKALVVQAILGDTIDVRSQSLDLVEIQGTIEQISLDKCQRAAAAVNGPVLIEDTSLSFNALRGLPGPYIRWFFEELGCDGLNNLLVAYEDKTAQAACTFAYCKGPGHKPILFQGHINGKIVPARGTTGFGWDPIFEYQGQTFAEMDTVEKNKISHSFQALELFKKWLEES